MTQADKKSTSLHIDPKLWKEYKKMCVILNVPIYKRLQKIMYADLKQIRGEMQNAKTREEDIQ